ncbi:MAG: DUF2793 domain-containing protein [Pseudomonadota bacterium]|nr:DUF2793 domain-containing protein [Pseudomonadota bacterium]
MSDDQTARLGLPYLAAGQMQKHVTLNEALTRLDALVQTAVVSRTIATQPVDPPDGALYILPPAATGADWGGRPDGALMRADAGGWSVVAAPPGMIVLVGDAGELIVRDGGAWVPLGARLEALQQLSRLGLGATADAANPFAARLNKALWTALETAGGGDGDLRMTFNKEGPSDVLSLLFQSGWGGRAELGLIGDDDFRLKVSVDGSVWRDACSVDRTSGRFSFSRGAVRRLVTVLDETASYDIPAWARTVEAIAIGGGGGGGAGAFGGAGTRLGGGGGGAAGISRATWPADQLTSSLTAVVGAGGAGGEGTMGAGGAGSIIYLGSTALLVATGGGGGLAGAAGGVAGAPGAGVGGPVSNAGGASSAGQTGGPGRSFDRPDAPGGGGGGGALDASGVAHAGGPGGDGAPLAVKAPGGAGGSSAGGGSGESSPQPLLHWAGGGGGGGGAIAGGAGHDGGEGGPAGGGGGGGGAGQTAAGAGGSGANGRVWLIAEG